MKELVSPPLVRADVTSSSLANAGPAAQASRSRRVPSRPRTSPSDQLLVDHAVDALVAVDGLRDVQVALQAAQHVGVGGGEAGLGGDQADHVGRTTSCPDAYSKLQVPKFALALLGAFLGVQL